MRNAARSWRHTVNLLNLKKKLLLSPELCSNSEKDQKGYTTEERNAIWKCLPHLHHTHKQPQHTLSAAVVAGARRASFSFQSSGTLETDGLAAAIRNDR